MAVKFWKQDTPLNAVSPIICHCFGHMWLLSSAEQQGIAHVDPHE